MLRDLSGVGGDSAAPQVCSLRCGSRREARQRETRGETGVSGSRPGRTQPARWARYLERGQWRGMNTILDTVGTPQVGQSQAVGLLCRARDQKDSSPERFLPPRTPPPYPTPPTAGAAPAAGICPTPPWAAAAGRCPAERAPRALQPIAVAASFKTNCSKEWPRRHLSVVINL